MTAKNRRPSRRQVLVGSMTALVLWPMVRLRPKVAVRAGQERKRRHKPLPRWIGHL